jgi:hypothetical protein
MDAGWPNPAGMVVQLPCQQCRGGVVYGRVVAIAMANNFTADVLQTLTNNLCYT